MTYVSNHADHAIVRAVGARNPSDRVLIRPEPPGGRLVEDHHWILPAHFASGEVFARPHRNPHRLEVPAADDANENAGGLARTVGLAFGGDAPGPIAIERKRIAERGRFDARHRLDAPDYFFMERVALFGCRDICTWFDAQHGQALGTKTQIDVEDACEASNQ
jgi:hypothetical protein